MWFPWVYREDELTLRTDVFGITPAVEFILSWASVNNKTGAWFFPLHGEQTLNPSLWIPVDLSTSISHFASLNITMLALLGEGDFIKHLHSDSFCQKNSCVPKLLCGYRPYPVFLHCCLGDNIIWNFHILIKLKTAFFCLFFVCFYFCFGF